MALLDAAMRHREAYFREEIDAYAAHIESGREEQKKKVTEGLTKGQTLNERAFNRRFDEKAKNLHIQFKNKQEEFNRLAYKKVEEVVGQMDNAFYNRFDNYATGFSMIAEEFLKAKNTTQLLTVCKLYNAGAMDHIFEGIEKKREEESKVVSEPEVKTEGNDEEVHQLS